jgi:hypothetical protein
MPEYLISADASNANYSSTLVAESPFVKYCEHQQEFYASKFKCLIWKALKLYHDLGRLPDVSWATFEAALDIDVNYASPASRDGLEQANENQILCQNGLLSKRTWATNAGLDYDEEQRNIEQDGGCGGSCGGGNAAGGKPFGTGGGFGGGSPRMGGYGGRSSSTGSGGMAGNAAPQQDGQTVDVVNEDGEVIGQTVIPSVSAAGPGEPAPVVVVRSREPFRPSARPQVDPGRRGEFESAHRTETLAVRAMDLLMERANGSDT